MKGFIIVLSLNFFSSLSIAEEWGERLSSRMMVIKVLCDSGQEPNLCPLWHRMTEAKRVYDTALKEWTRMQERLAHRYTTEWDDYIGSLCIEGSENDPESSEDDPFVYFCEQRAQLAEARKTLGEAQTLLEIVKSTAGVEGALNMEQAEQNVHIIEERYNIIKRSLTNTICNKLDEFPGATDFCLSLKLAKYEEGTYQESRTLLESMDAGRMDYRIRQFCKQNEYKLPPCDKLL